MEPFIITGGDLLSSSYGAVPTELSPSSSSSSSPSCFDSQAAPPPRPRTNDNYASPAEAVINMKAYESTRPGQHRKAALAALVKNASNDEQAHVLRTLLLQHRATEEGNSTEEKPIHATVVEQMRAELLNYNSKLQLLVLERQKKLEHLPKAEMRESFPMWAKMVTCNCGHWKSPGSWCLKQCPFWSALWWLCSRARQCMKILKR